MKSFLLMAAALSSSLAALSANAGETLSLADVDRMATVAAADRSGPDRIAASDAEVEAARDARRPIVTLHGEGTAAPGGQLIELQSLDGQTYLVQGSRRIGESGAFTPVPRYAGTVSLQADLLDFGRTASRVRAAEARARAARAEGRSFTADYVRSAREAYLGWLVAYARRGLAESHARDERARAATTRELVAQGSRPPADLNTAEQDDLLVEVELSTAESACEHARRVLEHLIGPWSRAAIPELALLELADGGGTTEPSVVEALALDHEATAAEATAEGVARSKRPVVSTLVEAGARGQADSLFPAYRVALTVGVPLWDGGVAAAQERASRARANTLRADANTQRRARADERDLARLDFTRAGEQVRILERLQRLAERDLERARESYKLGGSDLRSLADARERVSSAEAQVLTAKAERASAWLRSQN